MSVSKVIFDNSTLIDLTNDNVTAEDVAQGKTFHLANGDSAVGTAQGGGGKSFVSLDGVEPSFQFNTNRIEFNKMGSGNVLKIGEVNFSTNNFIMYFNNFDAQEIYIYNGAKNTNYRFIGNANFVNPQFIIDDGAVKSLDYFLAGSVAFNGDISNLFDFHNINNYSCMANNTQFNYADIDINLVNDDGTEFNNYDITKIWGENYFRNSNIRAYNKNIKVWTASSKPSILTEFNRVYEFERCSGGGLDTIITTWGANHLSVLLNNCGIGNNSLGFGNFEFEGANHSLVNFSNCRPVGYLYPTIRFININHAECYFTDASYVINCNFTFRGCSDAYLCLNNVSHWNRNIKIDLTSGNLGYVKFIIDRIGARNTGVNYRINLYGMFEFNVNYNYPVRVDFKLHSTETFNNYANIFYEKSVCNFLNKLVGNFYFPFNNSSSGMFANFLYHDNTERLNFYLPSSWKNTNSSSFNLCIVWTKGSGGTNPIFYNTLRNIYVYNNFDPNDVYNNIF